MLSLLLYTRLGQVLIHKNFMVSKSYQNKKFFHVIWHILRWEYVSAMLSMGLVFMNEFTWNVVLGILSEISHTDSIIAWFNCLLYTSLKAWFSSYYSYWTEDTAQVSVFEDPPSGKYSELNVWQQNPKVQHS